MELGKEKGCPGEGGEIRTKPPALSVAQDMGKVPAAGKANIGAKPYAMGKP